MNFRLTAILFAVILFAGIGLLVFTFTGDESQVPTEVLLEELAAVKAEQIDAVELEREDGATPQVLRLARLDGRWNGMERCRAAASKQLRRALMPRP